MGSERYINTSSCILNSEQTNPQEKLNPQNQFNNTYKLQFSTHISKCLHDILPTEEVVPETSQSTLSPMSTESPTPLPSSPQQSHPVTPLVSVEPETCENLRVRMFALHKIIRGGWIVFLSLRRRGSAD